LLKNSLLTTFLTLLLAAPSFAEDIPRWRGPKGDGFTSETLPENWPKDGPKQVWSKSVGVGYSSPIAVNGRIYIFALADGRDTLYCYDEAGQELWKQAYDGGWKGDYKGTRATPIIDGDRIYTYGGNGDLVARQLADGNLIFHINVLKETSAQGRPEGDWGMSSNPLVDANNIIVQGGSNAPFAIAVDKTTGKIAWKSENGLGGYAEPITIDVNGAKQIIVFAGSGLYGLNPQDGKTLWKYAWKTRYDVNASTPIYRDGKLFISSNYGKGCTLLQIGPTSATKVWENKELQCRFNPPILEGDILYGNSEGRFKAIKWADGKPSWPSPAPDNLGMGGSITRLPDSKMLMMTEGGKLLLAKVTPDSYKLLAEAQIFTETGRPAQIWSTPIIHNGKLYAKGLNELACYDFAGAK
jgi:outer membrane protein assembly factor BamB